MEAGGEEGYRVAQAIPLVRAIAMLPTLRWLGRQDQSAAKLLERHSLSSAMYCDPMRPIPLLKVSAVLSDLAREFGPDVACRIVAESDDLDLVQVGRVALGTRTPSEALARISLCLPYFCSHELVTLEPVDEGIMVRHAYGTRFDGEALHLMSQYALAVLDRIGAMTGMVAPRLVRAELPAHPEFGLAHLEPWFGLGRLVGSSTGALAAVLPHTVADRPFPRYSRDRFAELTQSGLTPLRNGGGFSDSVRILVAAMLEDEETPPSLMRVAEAAGLSTRTFQRRLSDEGMSLKMLLDEARQERARALIADGSETIASVATRLGYARPTSLNRSMQRWTGQSPSAFRRVTS